MWVPSITSTHTVPLWYEFNQRGLSFNTTTLNYNCNAVLPYGWTPECVRRPVQQMTSKRFITRCKLISLQGKLTQSTHISLLLQCYLSLPPHMYVYFIYFYVTTSLSPMRVYQNNLSGNRQPPAIVANSSPLPSIASATTSRNTHLKKWGRYLCCFTTLLY